MRSIYDYYLDEASYCSDMALATFELGLSEDWLRLAEGWLALLPLSMTQNTRDYFEGVRRTEAPRELAG